MSKNYIIVDTSNMFFRVVHAIGKLPAHDKVGLCMHGLFNSVKKAWTMFDSDAVIFTTEGKSWRKKVSSEYKRNRDLKKLEMTENEKEEFEVLFEGLNSFIEFLDTKTNATVLNAPNSEADDLIAIWIQQHPSDNHVIISTDTDFYQLLSDNVKMYNGVTEETHTIEGVFDAKGFPARNSKGIEKPIPDPEWLLFEKCIRGDKSDNIMSAYPGARVKGTKNKIGMIDAYADRHDMGFNWNSFMLHKWTDKDDNEVVVRDKYEANKILIDLTLQPDEIKQECIESIERAANADKVNNVGIHFMKFCGLWDLQRIASSPTSYTPYLNAPYTGK